MRREGAPTTNKTDVDAIFADLAACDPARPMVLIVQAPAVASESGRLLLLPPDANPDDRAGSLPLGDLLERLKACPVATQVAGAAIWPRRCHRRGAGSFITISLPPSSASWKHSPMPIAWCSPAAPPAKRPTARPNWAKARSPIILTRECVARRMDMAPPRWPHHGQGAGELRAGPRRALELAQPRRVANADAFRRRKRFRDRQHRPQCAGRAPQAADCPRVSRSADASVEGAPTIFINRGNIGWRGGAFKPGRQPCNSLPATTPPGRWRPT